MVHTGSPVLEKPQVIGKRLCCRQKVKQTAPSLQWLLPGGGCKLNMVQRSPLPPSPTASSPFWCQSFLTLSQMKWLIKKSRRRGLPPEAVSLRVTYKSSFFPGSPGPQSLESQVFYYIVSDSLTPLSLHKWENWVWPTRHHKILIGQPRKLWFRWVAHKFFK
jgi:hypothetical protein